MVRGVALCLLFSAFSALPGCGGDDGHDTEPAVVGTLLAAPVRAELDAQLTAWRAHVAEKRRLEEALRVAEAPWRKAQAAWLQLVKALRASGRLEAGRAEIAAARRATEAASRTAGPARLALHQALEDDWTLRLDILDLHVRIQKLEGGGEIDPDIKALGDSKTRDDALRRLLARNALDGFDGKNTKLPCVVNHVVWCPQREGPPMVAVFKSEGYVEEEPFLRAEGPGLPIGYVILFLSNGWAVPYFQGLNVIEGMGVMQDLTGDGLVEALDVIPCGTSRGDYYQCYVLPITPAQEDTLQVWWRKESWGVVVLAPDASGRCPVVIGPRAADGTIIEKARFVWSATTKRWMGPAGGTRADFYRYDPARDENAQADAFVDRTPLPAVGR